MSCLWSLLMFCLACSSQVSWVMTYRDLDNDLMKCPAFQTLVSGMASAERDKLQAASLGFSVPLKLYSISSKGL